MVDCKRCGKESIKKGTRIRGGQKVQYYMCRECGYEFWEGQQLVTREPESALPCPKCEGKATKYGTGFKAGVKVKKYRCSECGHVFLDGPVDESPTEE